MQFQNLYMKHEDLRVERSQLIDEGRDIREVEEEFERLEALSEDELLSQQSRFDALLDKTINLPQVTDHPYHEP